MNKKDLTDLGIAEDVADKIVVLHGKDIEGHKAKLAAAETQAATLQTQLTEAGKTIEGFKALKPEELKAAADDYKAKFEAAQTESAAQLAALKFDHALDAALAGAKVKDAVAVRAHLKSDMLKLGDDGKIIGLAEQLEPLQKSHDYLFTAENQTPPARLVAGANNQSVINDAVVAAARMGAGLPAAKQE